ncbi:MAG: MBL fold metallo-hydrolase [Proteobacteria bacterium]|nr:MAG: MBL fold metallo-hydrolase [Pseudomonadota bacterium]
MTGLAHPRFAYRKGLHDLGAGAWAWLQPDGSWGWSNAGLVTDGDAALLVDTLFDLRLTGEMLDAMRASAPAAARIGTLVNTHSNGDHTYGNALVAGAEIVATRACADEMAHETPAVLAGFQKQAPKLGPLGEYVLHCFGAFHFDGIETRLPTRTFEGRLDLEVGGKRVELIQVGPAHTRGDCLVHVPADRLVFSGDILFVEGTPIVWAGPVQNWIDACDRILALGAETIVPGHGPITDRRGVVAVRDYLAYVRAEAKRRFDAGLSARDAAFDIALGDYASWGDAERIAVNVATVYRELAGDAQPADVVALFSLMSELWRERRR